MTAPALSPSDLLRFWERAGSRLSETERAVLLLEFARPGEPAAELEQVSVGARDRQLLALSERAGGARIALCGDCPACDERVELSIDARDLLAMGGAEGSASSATHRLVQDGIEVEFRLPNSADLAAVARAGGVAAARCLLLDRCVIRGSVIRGSVIGGGVIGGSVNAGSVITGCGEREAELAGSALPASVQAALEREMERLDPLAVVEIVLTCPACEHVWPGRVDVSELVWAELVARAQRLLREVSQLAQVYHWSEANILAMTGPRRQAYLELAQA